MFFVDTFALTPPPSLVNEGPMSRIHKSDDSVVDADRHIGSQVSGPVLAAEFFYFRHVYRRIGSLRKACSARPRLMHENPDVGVAFLAGITARIDAIDL